ncbi:MAG: hypothetical protein GYA62_07240, partial [Bacteroidales bacterium]|nr:hypothetical protein [Bacteroidales bacterium]
QVIVGRFINNYSQYFSLRFLSLNGAGDASYGMIPGIGVLTLLELVLFIGIIPLYFFRKDFRKTLLCIILWLLVTPLPAALATGIGYSGNRAEGMLPVIQILSSLGFGGWLVLAKKAKWVSNVTLLLFGIMYFFGIYSFANSYFKVPKNLSLKQDIYGSLQAAYWLSENDSGQEIVVSRSLTEPQIFIAFAKKWNPKDYQSWTNSWNYDRNVTAWVDQMPIYKVGNYTFKSVDISKDMSKNRILVVSAEEFKSDMIPVRVFRYPDGTPNIYILDSLQNSYAKAN